MVSVVEENLHATLQLDIRHAIVGKLAALFITPIQTHNVLLRSVVTRKNIAADANELVPDKKNELLVRIINTQRMPRRVDLQYSLSPVLPD